MAWLNLSEEVESTFLGLSEANDNAMAEALEARARRRSARLAARRQPAVVVRTAAWWARELGMPWGTFRARVVRAGIRVGGGVPEAVARAVAEAPRPVRTRRGVDAEAVAEADRWCLAAGTSLDALRADRRDRTTTGLRRGVCAALRAAGWSLPQIGLVVGRDHSTVMYLLRTAA